MKKRGMASFEILVLLISIIAFGFLVGQSFEEVSAVTDEEFMNNYHDFLYEGKFSADYNRFFVESSNLGCCIEMNNGAVCQNVPFDYQKCKQGILPTTCETQGDGVGGGVKDCKPGCCVHNVEGLCATNTPKHLCEKIDHTTWHDNANCAITECRKGCCVITGETDYVTRQRCDRLYLLEGIDPRLQDFRQDESLVSCLLMGKTQKLGACVSLDQSVCSFGTQADCAALNGEFQEGLLCSHPTLNYCEKQISTGCVEGLDEIYWFDSCGNRENIYDANKEKSWNNGEVLSKEESCGADSDNINSEDCGNCNYIKGSQCSEAEALGNKIQDGDFICEDLNCIDQGGQFRRNGESWCVYDAYVGNGKDVVGSRHWKRYCIDGEIKVEPCGDFRTQVCSENTTTNSLGENISMALCRPNRWKNCFGFETAQTCSKDSDCIWKKFSIGENAFSLCLPHYPIGLRFWDNKAEGMSRLTPAQICAFAKQKCIVGYVKDPEIEGRSTYKCRKNCDCEKPIYAKTMNDMCINLGDCCAYTNIAGDITNTGYVVSNTFRLDLGFLNSLKNYLGLGGIFPKPGQGKDYGITGWKRGHNLGGGLETPEVLNWYERSATYTTIGQVVGFFFGGGGPFGVVMVGSWAIEGLGLAKGNTKEVPVQFKGYPWKAPTSNQKCELCNDNPLKPCSEYRCKSLGALCTLTNTEEENPTCFQDYRNDITPPQINFKNLIKPYRHELSDYGIQILGEESICIPEFTPVVITLSTNEFSKCKYTFNRTNTLEEMNYEFGEGIFAKNHTLAFSLPSLGSLSVYDVEGDLKYKEGKLDMYVRCEDTHGNYNKNEFIVRTCVNSGPDLTPATIVYSDPVNEGYVGYEELQRGSVFYMNEPAECKWDFEDKDYVNLNYEMNCKTELNDFDTIGWPCYTNFTQLTNGTNEFYIKCKDQPWLTAENETLRNINAESYIYTLYGSETTLKIDEILPDSKVSQGFEPISVSLEVKTSGGAQNGIAVCEYEFTNHNWAGEFYETNADYHKQTFSNMLEGEYEFKVSCQDAGANSINGSSSFSVEIDDQPPKLASVNKQGSQLVIITDELAKCYYTTRRCNFNLQTGEPMGGIFSLKHDTSWEFGKTYYIQCIDIWDNQGCTATIKPEDI